MRLATALAVLLAARLLAAASPRRSAQSQAPPCVPGDPSGRDLGCKNNPPNLKFHDKPVPHVAQEVVQSPAGYSILKAMFYNNKKKQLTFTKTRDVSSRLSYHPDGKSATPFNPSSNAPRAAADTGFAPQKEPADCSGKSGTDKKRCQLDSQGDGDGSKAAFDVASMLDSF